MEANLIQQLKAPLNNPLLCMQASNALRVAAINSVGTFILFLGKVIVVLLTLFIAVQIIEVKYEETIQSIEAQLFYN